MFLRKPTTRWLILQSLVNSVTVVQFSQNNSSTYSTVKGGLKLMARNRRTYEEAESRTFYCPTTLVSILALFMTNGNNEERDYW